MRIRAARLRCVGCERVGKAMTQEHVWPKWLIDHCGVKHEGVTWVTGKGSNPRTATIPLCQECNHRLGAELEGPVQRALSSVEASRGITDKEAELLIRWLWKYEAWSWAFAKLDDPTARYSARYTPIERVLGDSMVGIRGDLTLAVGLINANDPEFRDRSMGIDSGINDTDAIFVSGVFGRAGENSST
jgi:hypothetical protein